MQIRAGFAPTGLLRSCRFDRGVSWLSFLFVVCLGLPVCVAQQGIVLVGSGSSVPAPLYAKWAEQYNRRNPKIQMRYLALGTSEGIKEISHGSGDFAAGEAQLSAKERADGGLIEIPALLIGIVPIYNVPGLQGELRFSGAVLADIFLGHVKTWDAPAIAKLNPNLSLPDLPIKVVYRPAGKGSNYVFSDFLSKSSPQFRTEIGRSPSPAWPVGTPAERSSDIADKVKNEPGSIGYVEAQYAVKMHIPYGSVLNPAGHYIKATEKTISAACRGVEEPDWDRFSASLTNAPGAESFPIASFSWLYLRTSSADPARAAALSDLLKWMFSDGQRIASEEGYSELPPPLLKNVKNKVSSLH
jgi:phosphate transport system substrate-binding protein